jgi:hypothetical protein
MITVAFYKGRKRLFNRLVSWWTRGPYSHCELLCTPTLAIHEGKVRVASASYLDHGVRIKTIDWHPENWDLVTIDGDCREAVWWFQAHLGAPYDVMGIVGFVVRVMGHSKRRWFCSEACAAAMGLEEAWRFDPNTLHATLKRWSIPSQP